MVLILLIPLIAMQFTNEVKWGSEDFILMGLLLFLTGLIIEFIIKRVNSNLLKFIYIGIAFLLFLLIWLELAVGII